MPLGAHYIVIMLDIADTDTYAFSVCKDEMETQRNGERESVQQTPVRTNRHVLLCQFHIRTV